MTTGALLIGMPQMTYLFDTSVLIPFIRTGNDPDGYISRVLSRQIDAAISVITYYEIWRGANKNNELATRALLKSFKLHPLSRQVADRAVTIYKSLPKTVDKDQRKRLQLDLLIAATAEYFRYDIVTKNGRDFQVFDLKHVQVIDLCMTK